jgi:hypothetical protein
MAFIDEVGERIAVAAFEQAQRTDDPELVDEVSKVIGASSPTLQEVYNTAIRYLRAEARVHEFMKARRGDPKA